jgi:hypothetical protein
MTVRVAARFEGPPGAANGGYLAGLLAGAGPAQVTIRRPVPVETELAFDGRELRDGAGGLLAEVEPLDAVDVGAVPAVSVDAARAAAARTPLRDRHPFPGCFGCGPAHPAGLHCLAGPAGDGAWAVAWTPDETSAPFVWSALDCPSSTPVASPTGDPPYVLGRIAAHVRGEVVAGRPHAVVAWALRSEGRRELSASALLAEDGAVLAVARATWFALPSASSR